MKTSLLFASVALLATSAFADEGELLGTLTTLSGKTYQGVTIAQVYPDGVAFRHAKGAGKVLFSDLPADLRRRLGYDSKKAEAYEKQLADQREKERQARMDRAKEVAKAQAAAIQSTASQTKTLDALYLSLLSQQGYANYSYPVAAPAVGLTSGVIGGVTQFRHGYRYDPRGVYFAAWNTHGHHPAERILRQHGIYMGTGTRGIECANDCPPHLRSKGNGPRGQVCESPYPSRSGHTIGLVRSTLSPAQPVRIYNGVPALGASFMPAAAPAPRASAVVIGGGRR